MDWDNNEKRAKNILERFGFNFKHEYREEIIRLLEDEFKNYQDGSSEYLRVLCGFLFCIGNSDDIELLKKIKYKINFDVGCMIDSDWIDSMENTLHDTVTQRNELIKEYIEYYKKYFNWQN